MNVLVFGDSITYGKWDTQGGWADRLRHHYDSLAIEKLSRDFPHVYNLGISGDMTSSLLWRFGNETKARTGRNNEELVFVFAIGTNDSALENGTKERLGLEEYRTNLLELAAKAKKFSNKILFVGLMPCEEDKTTPIFWRNIHYTNERILEFDKVVQEVCSTNKLHYVPVFEDFKSRMNAGGQLFTDGLHPNNEGHQLIFELVRPDLDRLINQQ